MKAFTVDHKNKFGLEKATRFPRTNQLTSSFHRSLAAFSSLYGIREYHADDTCFCCHEFEETRLLCGYGDG
ncbi:hypothetical protein ABIA69_003215 [Lysinibacillus parviboronicapiens]|uniref:Uncharacterized protein n=1 Tax=Lysinibacillus parviboronicapiens TaxID=436516 RepID=A0ABV2PM73_9BACI